MDEVTKWKIQCLKMKEELDLWIEEVWLPQYIKLLREYFLAKSSN